MNRNFCLRASWALNLILAVVAATFFVRQPRSAVDGDVAVPLPPTTRAAKTAAAVSDRMYAPTASANDQRRWFVDELRAMGMSNRELAQIVLADLDAAWTKYSAALSLKCHGDPDTMAALQLEVDRTRDADMRAALGEEGFRAWDEENMRREIDRGNVPLTATETAGSYNLWKGLQQRQLDLREARLKGTMDESEVSAALAEATSNYAAQMKNLLGAERYAQAQRPAEAPIETSLRDELAQANPTAAQFQELLQTQQQWNRQHAELDRQRQIHPESAAYADQIKALDDAREQSYRRVLGDEAFAALQKEQDSSYAKMKQHEELWGLDDRTVDSVYGGLAYYQKAVADYQSQARAMEAQGQSVDWNAVSQNLKQFTAQTEQSLRDYLGADRYAQLLRNGVFTPLAEPLPYGRPNGNIDPAHTVSVR